MSRSSGTGSPQWFHCPRWRRLPRDIRHRLTHAIELTGRTRPARFAGAMGSRSTNTSREYACSCGHVGWSNHVDLERLAARSHRDLT